MGSSLSTGNTSVNGTVTAVGTFTANKNTAQFASSGGVLNADTTIGTVPGGKVWRIIGVAISIAATVAATVVGAVRLNGTAILQVNANGAAGVPNNEALSQSFDYSACPVLTAGQTVSVYSSSASSESRGSVVYVEESP